MKFTLHYIFENRYDIGRSRQRKLAERFVPFNFFVKLLSPYPTWLFLNLGIHQDAITFLSLATIVAGAWFLIIGHAFWGVLSFVIFGLLDSVDGDMARCQTKKTVYGGTLDSFGADFFYALAPLSIGFFLFSKHIFVLSVAPVNLMLMGALTSSTFILYRLINAKVNILKNRQTTSGQIPADVAKNTINSNFIKKAFNLYRHTLVRGNFFSEAGMIFWFFILVSSKQYNILAIYLIVILVYNLVYLMTNLIGSYIYFRDLK